METARKSRRTSLLYAAVLAASAASNLACAAPATVATTRYTVTIYFPPARGAPDIAPSAINNRSQVVGALLLPEPRTSAAASIWDGKTATEWNTFGDPGTIPNAINDAGKIAGRSYLVPDDPSSQRAVVWRGTAITYLRTLGGDYGEAKAINRAGEVAGYSTTTDGQTHATLWKGEKIFDLGTVGNFSEASGMNDSGDVVGLSSTSLGPSIATLWKNGKIRNLGTLGGVYSQALDINNKGYIVGWSYVAGSIVPHATLWANGKIKDLGTLGGATSYARAINGAGTIVGYSTNANPGRDQRGTLWDGSRIFDINTLVDGDMNGVTIFDAVAINDHGEIVVAAYGPNGRQYLLLTPTKRK